MRIFAQDMMGGMGADPMAGMGGDMMGMMGGADPMGGMGTQQMSASEGDAEAPPAPTFQVIYSPLDSVGKILADIDLKTFIQTNVGSTPEELADKVWKMYGGEENDLANGKPGKRNDTPDGSVPQEEEYNNTRNSRWERLPSGVSINEITSKGTLTQILAGAMWHAARKSAREQGEGEAEASATATAAVGCIKLASVSDEIGNYRQADQATAKCLLILADQFS